MVRILIIVGAVVVVLAVAVVIFSRANRVAPISWGLYGDIHAPEGVALGGYDPLTYASGTPVAGDAAHSSEWGGVTWRFATAENKARFDADPAAHAPAYGGYCAFAVSKGFTAAPAPTAWHRADGRLYLFADEKVKAKWVDAVAENRAASEKNWARR